jgi:hypothetical protein
MGEISINDIGVFIAIGIGIILLLIINFDIMVLFGLPGPDTNRQFMYNYCPSGKRRF